MSLNAQEQNLLLLVAEFRDQDVIVICTADDPAKQVPTKQNPVDHADSSVALTSQFQAYMGHAHLPQAAGFTSSVRIFPVLAQSIMQAATINQQANRSMTPVKVNYIHSLDYINYCNSESRPFLFCLVHNAQH